MKPISERAVRRAFQLGKIIGALGMAKAAGGNKVKPEIVHRLREEIAASLRTRAAVIGRSKRSHGRDLAQRYGMVIKERLIDHKHELRARRIKSQKAVEHLLAALVASRDDARHHSKNSLSVVKLTRFHLETAEPIEPLALKEKLHRALGFATVADMEAAGIRVETPLNVGSSNRAFNVLFAASAAELVMSGSQLTSILRSATGAVRLTKVNSAGLTKFKRLLDTSFGYRHGRWSDKKPQKDEGGCCCCCRCKEMAGTPDLPAPSDDKKPEPTRPTWSGIPDDTEWHLKQMRVKEAWAIKPPPGGRSQGEGIVIAHPDTGWREHREFDQSQLRFDLARNVIDGTDGKNATRHGTLTIPGAKYQAHGTGTGATIVSAEADPNRTHVSDIPFTNAAPTSSDVQITGVAPKAKLVPIRCTDTTVLLMDPNIDKAIQYAIDIKAHVVSISLGGILDGECERLVDRAVLDHNMIVVAAAGQIVNGGENSIVEPGEFTNSVAIAGSTPALSPWDGSCNGPKVAVSAPAKGVWFAGHFLDGSSGIYYGEGTSFSAAEVAGVAALWLAHWGRDVLIDHYRDVPLAHVFRQLLRTTAWKPRHWDSNYGAGIVDVCALLNEALPPRADIVAPSETDEFNLFDAFSDLLDMGGKVEGEVWKWLVDTGGAVGNFFGEMFNLNVIAEGLARVGAVAEGAVGDVKDWADEQAAALWEFAEDSLHAAADAWEEVAETGEEAVDTFGDILEEGGEVMEDLGEGAAEVWDQTTDFIGSLWP